MKLYYTAPSDKTFNEMKQVSIKIWQTYENDDYVSGKVSAIKDLQNVGDNFMYMFAMFDGNNQQSVITLLSENTKKAVKERLVDGGNENWFIERLGL